VTIVHEPSDGRMAPTNGQGEPSLGGHADHSPGAASAAASSVAPASGLSATPKPPGAVGPAGAVSAPSGAPPQPVPQAAPPLFPLVRLLHEALPSSDWPLPRISVVDVGAMFMSEAEDVWGPLFRAGLCESIVGFEPNTDECKLLNDRSAVGNLAPTGPPGDLVPPCSVRFLPHALGDGSSGEFRLCAAPMTSSMLEPNRNILRRFQQLEEVTTVVGRSHMKTKRLDDLLPELGNRVDFLKLDVQGYELAVLQGAPNALRQTLVLHTEVEFVEMYVGQPLFAEIDAFLRQSGFIFHRFASVHGRPMKPMHFLDDPLRPISQQLWADAVYVRDLWELQSHSRPELLRTALILHEVYHSYDVVHHVLQKLDTSLAKRYLELMLAPR